MRKNHYNLVKAGWNDEGIGWYGIPEKKIEPLFPDAKVGDYVTFGTYEQDNDLTNGAEPIEWQYIADKDGHKLLLAEYALDCRAYHDIDESITWENCTLRKWLNNDFYNTAFSAEDKEKIVTAYNENPDSTELYKSYGLWASIPGWSGGQGGKATADNVFLLSWTEARDYFDGKLDDDSIWGEWTEHSDYENDGDFNQKLLCTPTAYAKAKGVVIREWGDDSVRGCCCWWLRSPGVRENNKHATQVEFDGELDSWPAIGHGREDGAPAVYDKGIRPAILID